MAITYLSAQEAWNALNRVKHETYDSFSAMYSGDHKKLRDTASYRTFWKRKKDANKIHVPIAADIAVTSADLLFSRAPTFTVYHENTDVSESKQQERLDAIIEQNAFEAKLNEGAETASAMGDVYIKLRWNKEYDMPIIDIVQPDEAYPEYYFGQLQGIHFFTILKKDETADVYIRVHELYTKGRIEMQVFKGSANELGAEQGEEALRQLGFSSEIVAPIDDILAVHIPNIRPNRLHRNSMLGRSDLAGLRDMCDALDETYSSWIRDVRLAKARTIVPIDYMKRKPQRMLDGVAADAAYEFDPDVETYVAMDIEPDSAGGTGITLQQFAIRAAEHQQTCTQLTLDILSKAGYSPQTFGYNINGTAESGTALRQKERKSASTKDKKQTYWQSPLEKILTSMIRLDAVMYPNMGSHKEDTVQMEFSDSMGTDIGTLAATIETLNRATAISNETKIRMIHSDWGEDKIQEEIARVNAEFGIVSDIETPNNMAIID